MNHADLTIFNEIDAQTRFGELLDETASGPVGITRHDRLTAFVVSKRDFEAMLETIQELEDQLWLAKADLARKAGFVGAARVDVLLADARMSDHSDVKDKF
jgi:prevent-host-death family protein